RIHCMQHWYNLSDGAMEDALYEIASMRLFARLSLDSAVVVKFFWTRRSDGRVMHRRATGRQGWPAFRTVRVIG
ncbi:transposase, partial [Klebsiella pneumoniae]|uniref:transposase n=1 Tax=Klebsiella pneumoniae TaxID=573 RepID=UPI002FCDD5B4